MKEETIKNVLIVESKNDKSFVEAILRSMRSENTEVDIIDVFHCMEGLDSSKLETALAENMALIVKGKIQRIGILIDQDKKTKAERLAFVSQAATKAFGQDIELTAVNTFYTISLEKDTDFELACHFTNVDGSGELETLLKAIKKKDSTFADCLEAWKTCLEAKGKTIKPKDFDKFWLSNYIRFDTCSSKERKQAAKKCSQQNFDYILEHKDIFDLNSTKLTELKSFLSLFD